MCLKNWCGAFLFMCVTAVCVAGSSVVPTTTLAAQTSNNSSAANNFAAQSNGNSGAGNVSKVDIHTLLYPGSTTKVYAHLMLWFGGSNHMNVGYSSTDPQQVHRQIVDMISRGIDGVVVDWYGPNNSIDQATKVVMTEAEAHPGFTFAIMVDQGAIQWNSCSGCSPQQALIAQMQYIEQTYFPSSAYMKLEGRPVVTNFNIDLPYSVDWNAVSASLSTQPAFLFQNNNGFTHVLSDGSYSWVMPTTSDFGSAYLTSFYDVGMSSGAEETVGAAYKGFNDSLASWGSNRIMGQQCGQTWLQTLSKINGLYNSGRQLPALQLVTWNDYEEATEIESGISNCLSVSASAAGNSLQWTVKGDESTVDHYVAFISTDGTNLMPLSQSAVGTTSLNLCSYSIPDGNYTLYLQAVGKPTITNQISSAVKMSMSCNGGGNSGSALTMGASPTAVAVNSGRSGRLTVSVMPKSGGFNSAVALTCSGLPNGLKCSFAPPTVVPGASTVNSLLTISAGADAAAYYRKRPTFIFALWTLAFGPFGIALIGRIDIRCCMRVVGLCALAIMIVVTMSCGGQNGTNVPVGTAKSYIVTIHGDAGSIHLSAPVTVTVN